MRAGGEEMQPRSTEYGKARLADGVVTEPSVKPHHVHCHPLPGFVPVILSGFYGISIPFTMVGTEA